MITSYLTQSTSPYLSKYNTGLGNALFQIFTAYGFAKKYDHTFNNYFLIELLIKLKQFGLDHGETVYRNLKTFHPIDNTKTRVLKERPNYYALCDEQLIRQVDQHTDETTIVLVGYLQSHCYFNEYYEDVIRLVTPDESSLRKIREKYEHLFDVDVINISLHTRFNWGNGLKYNMQYYYDSIDHIINNVTTNKKVVLNVFSDDIDMAKHTLVGLKTETVFFEGNVDYIDMWCISLCDHHVLSNSTLSWWGAYLNASVDKLVVYPKDILRLVGGTVHETAQLYERMTQHYMKGWHAINTPNVIYQDKSVMGV